MAKTINNFLNSYVFLISAAFFYIISNFFIIQTLFLFSGNFWVELAKCLQIIFVILIILFILKKSNRFLVFGIIFSIYFLYLILIGYYVFTSARLDFPFFKRNFLSFGDIISNYYIYLLLLVALAFINSIFVYKIKFIFNKKYSKPAVIILAGFVLFTFFYKNSSLNNEVIVFAKTIYAPSKVIEYYQQYRDKLISESVSNNEKISAEIKNKKSDILPGYLDNIIILHLESLNGFLVNATNTPVFSGLAKEGIFFPKFYNNSVQTILTYETILCSLPSSFDMNLVNEKLGHDILCLPNFLKKFGYRNYHFKGGIYLTSARTEDLMEMIGFDELHNTDIMQKSDPQYLWGHREDIYYQRVFEYLKKNALPKKNFYYIDVGATNHWPFTTPKDLKNEVPYPEPKNHQQRLINTSFLQDKYLKTAWEEINKLFPDKNYTLLILGDHAWPAEIHPKNIFNEQNAFEENFTTSMILMIGDKYQNKIINEKYNQTDILPTLIELFNITPPNNQIRQSLLKAINNENLPPADILQIQPYGDRFINVIKDNLKYQYNSAKNNFILCDLANDPEEKNCTTIGQNNTDDLGIISKLLPLN